MFSAIIALLLVVWVCVYISYMYKLNNDFVYVNGSDRRNGNDYKKLGNKDSNEGNAYREHHDSQSDYGIDEKDKGADGPDLPLDEDDEQKGIDPTYKKHTKKHYIFVHSWVEFMIGTVLMIIFIFSFYLF